MDTVDKMLLAGGMVGALLVAILLVVVATFLSGTYSYEYRCTDNVVEQRLRVWWDIPIGGFDPIDGDPAGTCRNGGS